MPKETHKTGRSNRTEFVSVPVTPAQKEAIVHAARRLGLDVAGFARMSILKDTNYDPDDDEDDKK